MRSLPVVTALFKLKFLEAVLRLFDCESEVRIAATEKQEDFCYEPSRAPLQQVACSILLHVHSFGDMSCTSIWAIILVSR